MRLEVIHHQAILLFVAGKNQTQIAKKLKVSQTAVSKWRNDYDFNHALQQAFSRVYDDAVNKLAAISLQAAEELEKIIVSEETPIKYKLNAISLILTHGQKAKDYQLEHRLNKLEQLAFPVINEEDISEIE